MVHTLPIRKNHPSHNEHVEIDSFKMMKWFFYPCSNWVYFLLDLLVKKTNFSISEGIYGSQYHLPLHPIP